MNRQRPRVLVIDDTPSNLQTLGAALHGEFDMQLASSGAKGLSMAAKSPPDLILLDVMMPDMDGYETLRRLKADPALRAIPVIFITAKTESEDEMQGLLLGAVDYLAKPVVLAIVVARVRTHLALSQARLELEKKNLMLNQVRLELEQKNFILNDEKELLEDIVTRMHSASPFDSRRVRHIQKLLERTGGDIVLSAYRPDGAQHALVGDFSGHGLPASFGATLVTYVFYQRTIEGYTLGLILEEINRILCRQLPTQLYMAAGALEISLDREQMKAWNCGLPPTLCLSALQAPIQVNSAGLPLGISEAIDSFEPHALVELKPDMRIYQYSDGLTEAKSIEGKLYGQERLNTLVARIYREQLPLALIWDALDNYCGGQGLSDDAVLMEISR
jgi:two-component system, HptB-dependent secretion and biofilm response regulator